MGLGNPVPGHIQAYGEAWDQRGFIVTSTFAQHVASGRGAGIDLGNGRGWNNAGGAPVLAMEAGTVVLAGPLGLANVVRIRHANGYTSGYAHLATIMVARDQSVVRGQQIGTVGMTGADAPHLHGGYTDPSGAEQDWWPLLDQNNESEGSDVDLKGTVVPPITEASVRSSTTVTTPDGMGVVKDPAKQPSGSYDLLESPPGHPIHLAPGKALLIDWQVTGNDWKGSRLWYGLWMWSDPPQFGYVPAAGCSPLVPLVSEDGGEFTQADIDTAVANRDDDWITHLTPEDT